MWIENELVTINTNWSLGSPLMIASVDDKKVAIQFEKRIGQLLHLRHYGNKVRTCDTININKLYFAKFD